MATTTTKPPLRLSVSPHCRSDPSPSSPARRIPSWGSAASDVGPALSNYGERNMTPLPSPQGPKEWTNSAGPSDAWNGRPSVGSLRHSRARADSVFEEMRGASTLFETYQSPIGRTSMDSPSDAFTQFQPPNQHFHHTSPQLYASTGPEPPTSPTSGSDSSLAAATASTSPTTAPTRSKTLDFFGTHNDVASPVLSPPPNPPSRTSSLRRETNSVVNTHVDPANLLSSLSVASALTGRDRASSTSSVGSWLDREDAAPMMTSLKATPSGRWAARVRLSEMEKGPLTAGNGGETVGAMFGTTSAGAGTSGSTKLLFDSTSGTSTSSVPILERGDADGVRRTNGNSDAPASRAPTRSHEATTARTTPPLAAASSSSTTHGSTSTTMRQMPSSSSTLDSQNVESVPFKRGDMLGDYVVESILGKGAFSRVVLGRRRGEGPMAEPYALKIISKKSYEDHQRMRISVVREVEVLKVRSSAGHSIIFFDEKGEMLTLVTAIPQTVHHPSLVSLSTSFATPLYTVLVLDYCAGGELFDFLALWHESLFEGLARRIFGELCAAVGWMHRIGLVHRDIKLENVLLVSRPFPSLQTGTSPQAILESLPRPFVKLTDFGLSRFIDVRAPTLTTRCGSEAYASPELIMGKPYDGRRTDAWALGVVLYALVTGVLPFLEERAVGGTVGANGSGSGGAGSDEARRARRTYLLKIAKGEYSWPRIEDRNGLITPQVKHVVARLLVRDPGKRAAVEDLWDLEWMRGEGRAERVQGFVTRRERTGEEEGMGMGMGMGGE